MYKGVLVFTKLYPVLLGSASVDFFDLFCSYRVSVFTGFSSRSVYSFYRVFTEFPPKFVPSRSGSVGFSSEKKKQKKETSLDVTELLFFFLSQNIFFLPSFAEG